MDATDNRLSLRGIHTVGEQRGRGHSRVSVFIPSRTGHLLSLVRLLNRIGVFSRRGKFGQPEIGAFQLELLKFLDETEDRLEVEKSELEFKQAVRISPLNVFVPDLWDRLFTPGYIPPEVEEELQEQTFFPATDEEFEAMIAEWEENPPGESESGEIRGIYQT